MTRTCILVAVAAVLTACGDSGAGTGTETTGAVTSSSSSTTGAPTTSGTSSGTTDAGTGTSGTGTDSQTGSSTTAEDPFSHEPVCTSNKYWTMGDHESPYMHPGMACQTCHAMMDPPVATRFPIVGTVYPTAHEPDDCQGVDGVADQVIVEITTADARVIELPVNTSGNFVYDVLFDGGAIMFPITARVVKGDQERKMLAPQMTGNCNSCHTQDGTMSALGRILVP